MDDDRTGDLDRRPHVTALAGCGTLAVVVAVSSLVLRGRSFEVVYALWVLHNTPTAIGCLWLGRTIDRQRPRHGIARLFLVMGVLATVHVVAVSGADVGLVAAGFTEPAPTFTMAELPLATAASVWFIAWMWIALPAVTGTLMLLLFPDGRLPGPGWRAVPLVGFGGAFALSAAYAIGFWPLSDRAVQFNEQPLDSPLTRALVAVGGATLLLATLVSVGSLMVRWIRGDPLERRQLRFVGVSAATLALILIGLWPWQAVWVPTSLAAIVVILVVYTVAVLRSRIHDLDVVINRTVVGSLLAASITVAYLFVVVGVGSLVGRDVEGAWLPLFAVGLIAVLFEPARRRVRRLVDRWLYGRDRDAYEVLAELAGELRHARSVDAVAGRVGELLVRGTGAAGAAVVASREGADTVVVSSGVCEGEPVMTAAVVHDAEELGAVRLFARSPSHLAPDASELLEAVTGSLGAVLRAGQLAEELRGQLVELERSRERIITAQDEARRQLERDLHDGAQTQLIAIRMRLGITAELAQQQGPGPIHELLDQLGRDTEHAITTLRDLSRGLEPPLLATSGIIPALRASVRGLPLDVTITPDSLARYSPTVEATVYFCCLEAVRNAATHGQARTVGIQLSNGAGELTFQVQDDGIGFDPDATVRGSGLTNLSDRLTALGGRLTVDTGAGRGTRLLGELPVDPRLDAAQPLISDR